MNLQRITTICDYILANTFIAIQSLLVPTFFVIGPKTIRHGCIESESKSH